MRCKKHPADLSGGVCAACLRERLLAVMAAQAQKEAAQLDRRKSETQRPARPISFPRSVSPYVLGRKSTNSAAAWQVDGGRRRFYSTPHVAPNGAVTAEIGKKKKKGNGGRFSRMLLGLFRSRSDKPDSDSGPGPGPGSGSGEYSSTASGSPSWFSSIISGGGGRRRKQIRTFSLDEGAIAARRRVHRNRDRGMSPAGHSDDDDDEHCGGGSSGYSSESASQGWKQTPRMTPATAIRRGWGRGSSHSRNVSGLAFCLSPLVRASPNRLGVAPEMPMLGESRVQAKPHLSTATSFCKNRSRKLADFGRYSYSTNH